MILIRGWDRGENSTASEYGHVAYQIKGDDPCSNIVAHILPVYPLPRSKGQNSAFSEHGHVTCQIKVNDECSNMQAHILSFHIPSTAGWGQRSKHFFLKVDMLHIKLLVMEHRAPCKHKNIPSFFILSSPGVGSKGHNISIY